MVSDATLKKYANALITHYISLHEKHRGIKPVINRYTLTWGARDVITDLGYDDAKTVLEYFFRTADRADYSMVAFFRTYDELYRNYKQSEEDKRRREEIRRRTKMRVEAMENEQR